MLQSAWSRGRRGPSLPSRLARLARACTAMVHATSAADRAAMC
eukprot:CAMPEP_0180290202 /NCGR_PEP_ID=MMETSP0988-20121125/15264_1 /TAXON_ID=697907 /ORGANISM="non described non described, Strain CCMP2293" /LENGTH=42 /DNA_ID= /DNA_START= /DNA_END= /DNA_ORIENTATION=